MELAQVASSLSEHERYRVLVDAIADYAIYMLEADGRVATWNPGARRFKGYEASEIIGEHFSRFYTDEDRANGLPERALRVAAEAGRFENEGWRVRKDGSQFWAHVIIDPVWAAGGELIGYAKVTRDISERREHDEALRRSEEQFRLLVQAVTDYALYKLDPNGLVSSWNAGAERIKGYRPHEVIGSHFSRFYTDEDREAGLPEEALRVAVSEGRFEREGWRVRKDGSRFWANVVIDPIVDDDGRLLGFAKITRDITERRDAQVALEQAREQLLQSQKMDAIGQLTGGVAHDFNNLLTAILSSLELLRKRVPDDPRLTRLLDNAVQGVQRGSTLTQRMLAFARRQPLRMQAVDVKQLVEEFVGLVVPSMGPSIQVETDLEPTGLAVLTDPAQLETALLNLCVNSRDAMPEGGKIVIAAFGRTLAASNEHQLAAGDYVCLSVTDRGEGMDLETLSKAAEPFFTTKGVGKGSGLGLPMVHGLAAQSGGRLVLSSVTGSGTRAELWLPAAASAALPVAPAQNLAGRDEDRPLSILAVDDDALVLMNTTMMLEDLGHTVHEAINGTAALAILQSGAPIDLVVSDHAMPGMTGTQLAEAIHQSRPDMPIILATGYAELPRGASMELPLLSKPFSQKELAAALTAAMRR